MKKQKIDPTPDAATVIADLLVLVHCLNSGWVQGKNPYAWEAVKNANTLLTGDRHECGFDLNARMESFAASQKRGG